MQKKPEFYPNWEDDNHCLQAAVMIVLNSADSRIDWEAVNQLTQYEDGLYSWASKAAVVIAERISGTRLIGAFDYRKFAEQGTNYLKECWDQSWYDLQSQHASP